MIITESLNLILVGLVIMIWSPMKDVWCGFAKIDIFKREKF